MPLRIAVDVVFAVGGVPTKICNSIIGKWTPFSVCVRNIVVGGVWEGGVYTLLTMMLLDGPELTRNIIDNDNVTPLCREPIACR
jgi:hypothetical protein